VNFTGKNPTIMRRWLLALLLCLSVGCTRDPSVRKQKFFASGQKYFANGQYREAIIEFNNAVQIDPRFADGHYRLAESYIKVQSWALAYQELARTVELEPANYAAHLELANLLIAGRDLKQAQEHTDLLLQAQPENPKVHLAVANLLAAQDDLPGAIGETQKAISLAPAQSDAYLNLALLQVRTNQADAAEANFKKAAELDPKSMGTQLALGSYYQSRGRYAEAEQTFRQAMKADPGNPEARGAIARLYLVQGKKDDAENFLRQAKADFADNSVGYRMLGDFYYAIGDMKNAVAEYESLHQAHPKDLQVEKNYVQLLILTNGVDDAGKLNDEVLKAIPNDSEALIYRGQIQIKQGKLSDAVETLQSVIKNDPGNGLAHYHLGVAEAELGNAEQAEAEWQNAAKLRPDLIEPQQALGSAASAARRHGDGRASRDEVDRAAADFSGWIFVARGVVHQSQAVCRC
jgi:tetratricopeptide (TPR) repeat protein